mmetsp:Transcript_24609/g.65670  ORF Transcript_24609/g.65670 Transcript_24609/m.65670 type:complete len:236 (-) Transcript_24609:44-751(-)
MTWNWDGTNPPPEVWKNPPEPAKNAGYHVDPLTCPIQELIKDVHRQLDEADAEEERLHTVGPDLDPPQEYTEDGKPKYHYWDREHGTRPWPNLRDQLPPGWRQIRFAGSCFILDAQGSFVHTDDHHNQDPSTWGALEEDRGRWSVDGPTWEQSNVLYLDFADPERTHVELELHCGDKVMGQRFAYTGDEACDYWMEAAAPTPNTWVQAWCDDAECGSCRLLQRDDTEPDSCPSAI